MNSDFLILLSAPVHIDQMQFKFCFDLARQKLTLKGNEIIFLGLGASACECVCVHRLITEHNHLKCQHITTITTVEYYISTLTRYFNLVSMWFASASRRYYNVKVVFVKRVNKIGYHHYFDKKHIMQISLSTSGNNGAMD
jgi:hypothetical protein